VQKPKIVIDNLPEESFFEIYKDEDRMLINHQIRNQNAEKQFLEQGIIEQSYFEHVKFNQSDFYRLELTDSIFVGCDFSNCKMEEAVFYRCEFRNCKMLGINLNGAIFNNVLLDGTNMQLAALNQMKVKDTMFNACNLTDSSFAENKLQGAVQFEHCEIDQMSFYDTSLKHVNLSTCFFEKIDVEERLIRGMQVNATQAAQIAQYLLGLRVEY
jgi:uncharacterized protein YjbI with pentapeptide repeats